MKTNNNDRSVQVLMVLISVISLLLIWWMLHFYSNRVIETTMGIIQDSYDK